jgi:sugar O-acyltransferase (sialic acid O-acetyltransferase NeuD family)
MERIILVGGGGHCVSCIDVIRSTNLFEIAGILDVPSKVGSSVSGIPILGTDADISRLAAEGMSFLITIGQIKSSQRRVEMYNIIKENAGKLPIITSPIAYVSSSASIGEGTIIMHNSLINANAVIGSNCIINTGSLIEHEAIIGDFCHISTHAVINGQVTVGSNSFIGSNSVIANNVTLAARIIVAAGASILKTVSESGIYIGNPSKKAIY